MSELLVLRSTYVQHSKIYVHLYNKTEDLYLGFGERLKVKSYKEWETSYSNIILSNGIVIFEDIDKETIMIADEEEINDYYYGKFQTYD